MKAAPPGLVLFVTTLGIGIQVAAGVLLSQSPEPILRLVVGFGVSIGILIYAVVVSYRRGFEAALAMREHLSQTPTTPPPKPY